MKEFQVSPNYWFLLLPSFIENFGTHVITSVTIGGKDVIYVKQHQSSPLSTTEIKNYIQDIGNQRFSGTESNTSSGQMNFKDKASSTLFHSLFVLAFGLFLSPVSFIYFVGNLNSDYLIYFSNF